MIESSLQEFYQSLIDNSPILGIDYGIKKIGFAISDPSKKMAMPLEVMDFKDEDSKFSYIVHMIDKHNICGLVVGLPINMNGTKSAQSDKIEAFAKKLGEICPLPIFLQDERLSTKAAHSLLRSAGINRKDRDAIDDQISASMILETVINSQ